MKRCIFLLLFISLIFSCKNTKNDNSNVDFLKKLKETQNKFNLLITSNNEKGICNITNSMGEFSVEYNGGFGNSELYKFNSTENGLEIIIKNSFSYPDESKELIYFKALIPIKTINNILQNNEKEEYSSEIKGIEVKY